MLGVLLGPVGATGAFVEGSGALWQARKTKMAKIWPNFKTAVLANYSPKL